jgi:hypothetical protein
MAIKILGDMSSEDTEFYTASERFNPLPSGLAKIDSGVAEGKNTGFPSTVVHNS